MPKDVALKNEAPEILPQASSHTEGRVLRSFSRLRSPFNSPELPRRRMAADPNAQNADEINALTRGLARAKQRADASKDKLRDLREKLADSKQELEEARQEADVLREELETAEAQAQQYRNWWFNEVQFTKLLLNKVPNPNRDWDLVRTSQSHYLGRF